MAEKEAQERAAKTRIITHMNNDHHDSVIRYLEHYGKVSSFQAYDGKVSDVDLNALTLSCHGQKYRVPFNPPMSSYREARERVVDFDRECRIALGQSDVTVREYLHPTGLYAIEFLVISATFLAYSQRWWFAKGQIVESILGSAFAKFSWTIQPWLLGGMILIHGAEMVYFTRNRLRAHSVHIRSRLWWIYAASSFIEGVFLFKRFDDFVKASREKQKH